jgi:hypothetical protein
MATHPFIMTGIAIVEPPGPCLDYKSYFYIVDRILQLADPDVLLTFRRTSKLYQKRVDRLLAHLVVEVVNPPKSKKKRHGAPFRHVRMASTAGWLPSPLLRPDLSKCSEEQAQQMIKIDRARLEPLLACATVLELNGALGYNLPTLTCARGPVQHTEALRVGAAAIGCALKLTHLRVVSDHLGRYPSVQFMEAQTVVIFSGAATPGPGEQAQPLNHIEPNVRVCKIVINIPYCRTEFFSHDGHADLQLHREAGTNLQEVVFVFQEVDAAGGIVPPPFKRHESWSDVYFPRGDSNRLFEYDNDGAWITLHDNLSELCRYARPRLTFVGLPSQLRMGDKLVSPVDALASHLAFIEENEAMFGYTSSNVFNFSFQMYTCTRSNVIPKLELECSQWPTRLCRPTKDNPRNEPIPDDAPLLV